MLVEFLEYLWHYPRIPKEFREIVQEQIAIKSRYARQRAAWTNHLSNCKSFILENVDPQKDSRIVLLGAGLLNDVPIRELSEKFFEVILLDAFFLDSTLAQIKKYPNVKFISKDISKIENLTDLDFDHLVSLNILSQLLLKEESIAIKQQIINKHWGLLVGNTVRSKVILITDYLKQIFDRNNQKKLEESSLADYDIPQADRYWDWDLAPLGELDSNYSMMLKVLAKVL